jgi:predicted amidohydrolase
MKPVFSLPYILSTYRNLGIPTDSLIKGCTSVQAKIMGMAGEIGTLAPGARADITILKEKNVNLEFSDWFGHSFTGSIIYEPRGTIKNGRLYYLHMEVGQQMVHSPA